MWFGLNSHVREVDDTRITNRLVQHDTEDAAGELLWIGRSGATRGRVRRRRTGESACSRDSRTPGFSMEMLILPFGKRCSLSATA